MFAPGRRAGCRNLTRIGCYRYPWCGRVTAPRGIVVQSTDLAGRLVLVVEDEPLIALDLQTVL
jgi:hypothetical protein